MLVGDFVRRLDLNLKTSTCWKNASQATNELTREIEIGRFGSDEAEYHDDRPSSWMQYLHPELWF